MCFSSKNILNVQTSESFLPQNVSRKGKAKKIFDVQLIDLRTVCSPDIVLLHTYIAQFASKDVIDLNISMK